MSKSLHKNVSVALLLVGALDLLGACSNMSQRGKEHGHRRRCRRSGWRGADRRQRALGTVGGAAVGGVIGNQVSKDKK